MTSPTSRTPGPGSAGAATSPAPSGKPPEVEEWVDEHIHRPIARQLVRLLLRTPLTPNHVTFISGLLGVSAGLAVVVAFEQPGWRLGAALLLFACVIFDCSDGQLARARGTSSTYGAILDGVADYAVGLAMGIGGSYFMVRALGSDWWWLMGLAGVASSVVQAALFDHAKTSYIARLRSGYAEREDDPGKIAADLAEARRDRRFRDALLLWLYLGYSRAQQRALALPRAEDPAAFRARYAGRMRAWTWQGSGTHMTLAYTATALSYWWTPAAAGYFVATATVFNLFLLGLVRGDRWTTA